MDIHRFSRDVCTARLDRHPCAGHHLLFGSLLCTHLDSAPGCSGFTDPVESEFPGGPPWKSAGPGLDLADSSRRRAAVR
jgi:hypothetical protein